MNTANGGPVGIPGPPLPKKVPVPFNYTCTILTVINKQSTRRHDGFLPDGYRRAQTVNNIPISQIETEYIQIMATTKLLSTKVTVDIDFGQRNKAFALKDT